ncbi:MAG: hypothetical protein A2095_05370 [Sphingomonadales bacterium GWF1_63_6]|nr:MAG: hypothetical protein A2095_05370 [Sphingomonadales bacterium GWF1_63_6]
MGVSASLRDDRVEYFESPVDGNEKPRAILDDLAEHTARFQPGAVTSIIVADFKATGTVDENIGKTRFAKTRYGDVVPSFYGSKQVSGTQPYALFQSKGCLQFFDRARTNDPAQNGYARAIIDTPHAHIVLW